MNKGKVLVIDDSPLVRKLSEIALQEAGYEVFTAENGEEGLKKTEEIIPDLILVNFIMPKLTGLQFCEQIKLKDELSKIPIILITSKGENAAKSFFEKSLITDYLQKPYKSEDLVEKVEQVLSRFKATESALPAQGQIEFDQISKEEIKLEDTEDLGLQVVSEEFPKITLEEEPIEEVSFKGFEEEERQEKVEEVIEIQAPLTNEVLEELDKEEMVFPEKTYTAEKTIETLEFDETFSEGQVSITLDEDREIESSFTTLIEDVIERPIQIVESQGQLSTLLIEPDKEERPLKELYSPEQSQSQLESRLQELAKEIILEVNNSIERAIKKHGLSKTQAATFAGSIRGKMTVESLLQFIIKSQLDGVLTLFSASESYEFLIFRQRILYCLGERVHRTSGSRLLRELSQDEIRNLTFKSLTDLKNSSVQSFIFEERTLNQELFLGLSGFTLEELFEQATTL